MENTLHPTGVLNYTVWLQRQFELVSLLPIPSQLYRYHLYKLTRDSVSLTHRNMQHWLSILRQQKLPNLREVLCSRKTCEMNQRWGRDYNITWQHLSKILQHNINRYLSKILQHNITISQWNTTTEHHYISVKDYNITSLYLSKILQHNITISQ